jgi:DNA invertase Pin-like site-specific DNA recombinase
VKIALYARVSRTDLKLENQTIKLEEYAKRMGWKTELFLEQESTRNTRPVKEGLKKKVFAKEFDGIAVSALDRWARSVSEFALELNDFSERGITFVSLREGFDISTSIGRAMAQLCCVFAELDRELIRERTIAGLDRARASGKKLGRPRKRPINSGGDLTPVRLSPE